MNKSMQEAKTGLDPNSLGCNHLPVNLQYEQDKNGNMIPNLILTSGTVIVKFTNGRQITINSDGTDEYCSISMKDSGGRPVWIES